MQLRCFFPPPPLPPPIVIASTRQLAEEISRYLSNWKIITISNFLFNIINPVYKIPFPFTPCRSKPIVLVPSKLNSEIIEVQILDHLEKAAISNCSSAGGQDIYRVFTVKK